ncbi:PadR family transcriptional regulator [Actinoplanes xinjiangensis]|uniref:PadR family transcriptional regulator n=1 Tax=Actinoplanes xinjiangensis TaxID=512350 RepID=A0A316F6S8_9ACTN|nr:PadR family transcriptional regulator [Actinoplanes xinjiangensis]PWK41140.1 PadR family transcriptional regulator [Actinoplanes xinjiangensis]GIF42072.1 hypothetical protein Axi01nite_63830 [Actinoplanes xinjiangensis]
MPKLTLQVRLVLAMLAAEPDRQRYGLEIVESTGLLPGTIYPILARLEQAGWLHSQWEEADESVVGRPRRRYYRLTPDGAAAAAEAQARAEQRAGSRVRPSFGGLLPGGAH